MMPNQEPGVQAALEIERKISVEVDLHRRADDRGREQCEAKQKRVKPVAFARGANGEIVWFRVPACGVNGGRWGEFRGRHNTAAVQPRLLQGL